MYEALKLSLAFVALNIYIIVKLFNELFFKLKMATKT